jgi:sugar lactone lactonase YvrE
MRNLRYLSIWQRRLVFFLVFGGILMALIGVTLLLANQALNGGQRVMAIALAADTTVRQFAALPDDNAYPSAVVAAPDGTVYTGSFVTGAVWQITPDGAVSEIPGTRAHIGAVSGLAVAPDGSLLVVDDLDTDPRSSGGKIVRVQAGKVSVFAEPGFVAPNDIVIDGSGYVYVSDPGSNEVWRFDADGANGSVWWVPPQADGNQRRAITGLAYDAARDAIIITDPEYNEIYRVAVNDGTSELLYRHGGRDNPPGFDGATVTPDGKLYVAALGQNGVALVDDDKLYYIAGSFRGASDVEFAAPNRLYVTNFDQSSIVLPLVRPELPFALDVIELAS